MPLPRPLPLLPGARLVAAAARPAGPGAKLHGQEPQPGKYIEPSVDCSHVYAASGIPIFELACCTLQASGCVASGCVPTHFQAAAPLLPPCCPSPPPVQSPLQQRLAPAAGLRAIHRDNLHSTLSTPTSAPTSGEALQATQPAVHAWPARYLSCVSLLSDSSSQAIAVARLPAEHPALAACRASFQRAACYAMLVLPCCLQC